MQPSNKLATLYSAMSIFALLSFLLAFSLDDVLVAVPLFIISVGCFAFVIWILSNPYWVDPDPEWGES